MAGKTSDRVADQRKEIVDHVIEEMGKGGFSWLKPWADSASPHNPVTGSTYHGRNRMHLAVMAAIKGYNDPRWVTFNQAKKVGWKLQKGAKSCIVEKWKMYPVKDSGKEKDKSSPASDDTQNLRMIPRCVGYWSVFNASQFDGVPPLPQLNRNDDIEIGRLADDVKDSSRCPVREAPGNEAYYVPAKDMIAVPPRDSFANNEAFLVTLLHEMGHSTGHPNALGRDLSGTFGSKSYAFEELSLSSPACSAHRTSAFPGILTRNRIISSNTSPTCKAGRVRLKTILTYSSALLRLPRRPRRS